jgi:biopolymer transport protein ExbD
MVPFIDVMLVLLIIFMVTAPMLTPAPSTCPAPASPPSRRPEHGPCADRQGRQRALKTPNGEQTVTLQDLAWRPPAGNPARARTAPS